MQGVAGYGRNMVPLVLLGAHASRGRVDNPKNDSFGLFVFP